MNIDHRNSEYLGEFLTILEQRGLRNRINVYLGHVAEYTLDSDTANSGFTKEEFAAKQAWFDAQKFLRNWRGMPGLPKAQGGPMCTADNPAGLVIAPGGLVSRCWNEVAEDASLAWGRLEADGMVAESNGTWPELGRVGPGYNPFKHEPCQACVVQPLCRGGCPWESNKLAQSEPGYCTPLRWNLGDRLRLWHLSRNAGGVPVPADFHEFVRPGTLE